MTDYNEKYLSVLETVATASESKKTSSPLNEKLQALLAQSQMIPGYDQVQLYLKSETDWSLAPSVSITSNKQFVSQNPAIHLRNIEDIFSKAVESKNVVWIIEGAIHEQETINLLSNHLASEIAVPVIIDEKVFGMLYVQSDRRSGLDEIDASFLRFLANQTANLIHKNQLQTELEAAKRNADSTTSLKAKFLSNISHELRTPLNGIINLTGFVADGILGDINEEQQEALYQAVDSGQHLLSLINDVLDLTKLESSMMTLLFDNVDLSDILQTVLKSARSLAKNKPITIHTHFPDEGLPKIVGDRRRIRQILLNVLSNAVKFTIEGQINISAERKPDSIQFMVQDTGIGIAEEDYPHIFESLTQANHSLSNVVSTGLGLPITKKLVELHGGKIWFESELAKGSTFYIILPEKPPTS